MSLRMSKREFYIWVALLAIQMQPLEILISGYDPSFPSTAGSARGYGNWVRFILSVASILFIVRDWTKAKKFVKESWPFLAFLALLFFSTIFAQDTPASMRYMLAIIFPAVATSYSLAALGRPIDLARAWIYALGALAILSVLTAVILPKVGVVSLSELPGIGTPGNWRGAFPTKNVLGHLMGIAVVVLMLFGSRLIEGRPLLYFAIGSAILCLALSQSSTGYIMAAMLPIFYFAAVKPTGWLRALSIAFAFAILVSLTLMRDVLVDMALGAVGKTANLSGRAAIWELAERMIPQAGFFGFGIGYTTTKPFMTMLNNQFGVPYIHNEYIDLVLNMGVVGVTAFCGVFIYAVLRAWSTRPTGDTPIAREIFSVLLVGWFISGMTETTTGPMMAFAFIPLFGFFSVKVRADHQAAVVRQVRAQQRRHNLT